jgi:hypothetical protein
MKEFWFDEPVWMIGYQTNLLDFHGRSPRENYLCHTFFSDQRVDQREDNELKGIYSDAFTPEVRLPDGFGIPLAARERLHGCRCSTIAAMIWRGSRCESW